MSTSDKRQLRRAGVVYVGIAAFCGFFSLVYEHFSHGVYSNFMIYLFLFPLLGGALPSLLLPCLPAARHPSLVTRELWRCGVATWGLWSCLTGVFEIYGGTAPLLLLYRLAGSVLLAAAAISYLLDSRRKTA